MVAWLSIVVMPCVVVAASPSALAAASTQQIHVDCHGAHADVQSGNADCSCVSIAVASKEGPKTQRVDFVAFTASPLADIAIALVLPHVQWERPLPIDDDGPPVYLATQRLRI